MEYVVNGKKYTDLKEAEEAEKKWELEKAEKQTLVETKKTRANEIADAFKELTKTEKEENKKYSDKVAEAKTIYHNAVETAKKEYSAAIKEKQDKYSELKEKFIKDYGSYHMSYYADDNNSEVSISDIIDSVYDAFDSFWRF